MAVVVTAMLSVESSRLEDAFRQHADVFRAIADDARRAGARHHRFVSQGGRVMILDEWDSSASFHAFFQGDSRIAELMQQTGVEGPPDIEVWETMDSPDQF